MDSKNEYKRLLLSKNLSGRVEFCQTCNVVEFELGAISLRLHADDMQLFSQLIQEAEMRLRYCKVDKANFEDETLKTSGIH